MEELIRQTVPSDIRLTQPLALDAPLSEHEYLSKLKELSTKNKPFRSLIGMGVYGTATLPVLLRNIFENPSWYTSYTPYQAEISQGRLEALLNFQTMVVSLTGLPLANCSLLDEATAAAEAMRMMFDLRPREAVKGGKNLFFVDKNIFPQTLSVLQTRAQALGIVVEAGDYQNNPFSELTYGAIVQYPAANGEVRDYAAFCAQAHDKGILVCALCDLLSLALLKEPAAWGADIAVGSAQRFGLPMGFGGPSTGYLSCRDEYKRQMPGRIIGISVDRLGNKAYRMALQTREQHIKREKATSNICTASALMATMAGMFAIYHGSEGVRNIARHAARHASFVAAQLEDAGFKLCTRSFFDTIEIVDVDARAIQGKALAAGFNFFYPNPERVRISFDELSNPAEAKAILNLFGVTLQEGAEDSLLHSDHSQTGDFAEGTAGVGQAGVGQAGDLAEGTPGVGLTGVGQAGVGQAGDLAEGTPGVGLTGVGLTGDGLTGIGLTGVGLLRRSPALTEPIFNTYHSETELMRYIKKLERRDLSLTHSMIPLGSCTMKLNAAAEMLPLSWAEWSNVHPFAPANQAEGYMALIHEVERDLAIITGLDATSLQPNSGAAGEYAGLMVVRAYHLAHNQPQRNIAIIPTSAHGTNPASAAMAGMELVLVSCDENGNINVEELRARAIEHRDRLSCMMITYPSTHGVFEVKIKEIVDIIHENGGLVYMDGANMNAQVGLTHPGAIGADVCHLNLHKTFAMPHGGGGPGLGPICVTKALAPYLPNHPVVPCCNTLPTDASLADTSLTNPSLADTPLTDAPMTDASLANTSLTDGHPTKPFGDALMNTVASSPYGSPLLLPITHAYIKMLGAEGLQHATEVAILNANYLSVKLKDDYQTLYTGATGRVAHECIIDLRHFRKEYGVDATDIAKRLMDYGFHSPTLSFPVVETLMVEPTESESPAELDRFVEAMKAIKAECEAIAGGVQAGGVQAREVQASGVQASGVQASADREDNLLKNAPHTAAEVCADTWNHPYPREQAAYPLAWIRDNKFWPHVARVDNAHGDRNLVCVCG